MKILLIIFIVLYWFFESLTEAMTFYYKKSREVDSGKYHQYRLFEAVSIFMAIVIAFFIICDNYHFLLLLTGAWILGWTVYEAVLTIMSGAGLWKKVYPYHLNIFIKTISFIVPSLVYWISCLIGLLLIYKGVGG